MGLKEVGDPVELAKQYYAQGADELVFLDITATHEHRDTMVHVVEKVANEIYMPFTVGGGIKTIDDIRRILRAGADKVSLNSAAVDNPELIREGAQLFGDQCMVLAIDGKKREDGSGWNVVVHGGRIDTGIDVLEWAQKGVALGAGEILLTSMDADGTKQGFDLELCQAVRRVVNVPIIASGGAGKKADFVELFETDAADAGLAASLFHYGELTVGDIKQELKEKGIPVRL